MLANFRTYQLAIDFYKSCKGLGLVGNLRDQLHRASSSVVLNLAEGSGRRTKKDKARFYHIAMGSARECQAIIDLVGDSKNAKLADRVAANVYCLIRRTEG